MNNKANDTRIPVTVLTGFLGSGKTTLLNRILTAEHGKRIAVIENEFGEIGIDQALVVRSDEEIFEMNNGCICCTVRGDLIRILSNLMKRRNKFDYILIETTGMADPGPVAQTFSMDDELKPQLRLDGVVTLVDAKHVIQHIDDSEEVQKQIAFADVILLNKIDLVSEPELEALESRVKRMNANAKVYRTCQGELPLDQVLHVGGFNVERALEVDPKFLEPEYPFEWGGIIMLPAGEHTLTFEPGPDPAMQVAFFPATGHDQAALDIAREQAVLIYSDRDHARISPSPILPSLQLLDLEIGSDGRRYTVQVEREGPYALFTQHHPDEFNTTIQAGDQRIAPVIGAEYKPDHEHDEEVTSVGVQIPGELDVQKLQGWMNELLATKGPDIYRSKGVLSVSRNPERMIFQGVHMLFNIQADRPWGDEPRHNTMIFIGRNLDRKALTEGFASCLAE